MNREWLIEKSAGLTAIVIGLGFVAVAFFDSRYRYFHLCVAILALFFGHRQLRKRETPFQKREREFRRKRL